MAAVNTKLDKYSFFDEVFSSGRDSLGARCSFPASRFFALVEAMAQLASLHFRSACGPGRQTFLLKVKNISPWLEEAALEGVYELRAELLAKSGMTGLYRAAASASSGEPLVGGEFYISSVEAAEFKDLTDPCKNSSAL
ncbi:MAG: hypothetical protein HY550_03105 [Elusimicrobia bacterium]|nr:hypothetical protein [Elusimicrobiota bacterium]